MKQFLLAFRQYIGICLIIISFFTFLIFPDLPIILIFIIGIAIFMTGFFVLPRNLSNYLFFTVFQPLIRKRATRYLQTELSQLEIKRNDLRHHLIFLANQKQYLDDARFEEAVLLLHLVDQLSETQFIQFIANVLPLIDIEITKVNSDSVNGDIQIFASDAQNFITIHCMKSDTCLTTSDVQSFSDYNTMHPTGVALLVTNNNFDVDAIAVAEEAHVVRWGRRSLIDIMINLTGTDFIKLKSKTTQL